MSKQKKWEKIGVGTLVVTTIATAAIVYEYARWRIAMGKSPPPTPPPPPSGAAQ
jgi:hypothetical protein